MTVPVGVPPAPETTEVNVTEAPAAAGFADEAMETLVVPGLTVMTMIGAIQPRKCASPL